jgi:hypothetical protein
MRNRGSIATALMLIGIGAWFLAIQFSPMIKDFAYGASTWPLPIIGIGAFIALLGLLTWSPGMFIPACIVAGVGGLLYYQNTTGDWASWSYAWALIPGFVGVGILLTGLCVRKRGPTLTGFWMAFISVLVFSIFGAFFGATLINNFWPVLIIALGLYILLRGMFKRRPV